MPTSHFTSLALLVAPLKPLGSIRRRHQQRDTSKAARFRRCIKRMLANRRIGNIPQAKIGERFESAFHQMFGRELPDHAVVEAHARHRRLGKRPEILTTGAFRCLTHAASLGVLRAAIIPSPRHPRRSSTDKRQRLGRRDVRPVAARARVEYEEPRNEYFLVGSPGKCQSQFLWHVFIRSEVRQRVHRRQSSLRRA